MAFHFRKSASKVRDKSSEQSQTPDSTSSGPFHSPLSPAAAHTSYAYTSESDAPLSVQSRVEHMKDWSSMHEARARSPEPEESHLSDGKQTRKHKELKPADYYRSIQRLRYSKNRLDKLGHHLKQFRESPNDPNLADVWKLAMHMQQKGHSPSPHSPTRFEHQATTENRQMQLGSWQPTPAEQKKQPAAPEASAQPRHTHPAIQQTPNSPGDVGHSSQQTTHQTQWMHPNPEVKHYFPQPTHQTQWIRPNSDVTHSFPQPTNPYGYSYPSHSPYTYPYSMQEPTSLEQMHSFHHRQIPSSVHPAAFTTPSQDQSMPQPLYLAQQHSNPYQRQVRPAYYGPAERQYGQTPTSQVPILDVLPLSSKSTAPKRRMYPYQPLYMPEGNPTHGSAEPYCLDDPPQQVGVHATPTLTPMQQQHVQLYEAAVEELPKFPIDIDSYPASPSDSMSSTKVDVAESIGDEDSAYLTLTFNETGMKDIDIIDRLLAMRIAVQDKLDRQVITKKQYDVAIQYIEYRMEEMNRSKANTSYGCP